MSEAQMNTLEKLLDGIEVPLLHQVGKILTEVCRFGEMASEAKNRELSITVASLKAVVEDCDSTELELILRGLGALVSQIGHERFGKTEEKA